MWSFQAGGQEKRNFGEFALTEAVLAFMQTDGYQELLERVMEGLYRRMNEFVSEMEENLELFDTLALLFPQRNWSYSVKELKKEPFYVQLKMLKNYSTFLRKAPTCENCGFYRRELTHPRTAYDSHLSEKTDQTVCFSVHR